MVAFPTLDETMVAFPTLDETMEEPLVQRRHSIGTVSHVYLAQEKDLAPDFFLSLKKIFDATPDEKEIEHLDTLASQTLATLFGDEPSPATSVTKRRHSIGSGQPLAHELHEMTCTTMLNRHESHEAQRRNATRSVAPPSGPEMWLQALAQRKSACRLSVDECHRADAQHTDRPPVGWMPTVKTVMAVLKLRKLHAARASDAAAFDARSLEGVTPDEIYRLADPSTPDFDVQAFIEECWITQSLADPARNATIVEGAYGSPPLQAAYLQPPPQIGYPPSAAPMGFAPQLPAAEYTPYTAPLWQAQPAPAMPAPAPMAARWGTWGASAPSAPPAFLRGPHAAVPERSALVAMAMEQEGSRRLQQHLFTMAPPELAAAVAELAPHLTALASHAFGNYLVSALASLPVAHAAIHDALTGHVCRLMQHPQGSRVVQAALERLPPRLVASLAGELAGRVAQVASGTHGSWSVVAAYKHAGRPSFIVHELASDIGRLASQQNGSRVVQRVLLEASRVAGAVSAPIDSLVDLGSVALRALAEDRFGNYVVQLALRHASAPQRARLIEQLLPGFGTLAVGKCGSNVAEAIVQLADRRQLAALRAGLGPAAAELRAHMFGTYVMNALDGRTAGVATVDAVA